ncbi:ABC transporter permease protein [Lactiplantibacillus plantarum]|uniref:ABC transporter permease n=1 Tax=Lactiplantibacillus plantarum TaxID=1590 RepID=UPI0007ABEB01|nr:ABC transporter permease [Lactiplantibacillus plantarum]KZE01387.1 ABC transporter permease protein [Lactiplantibacillus plantarum]MCG0723811.1 ABC transporter permease [Lactiplantibacillus plantarum]
MQTNIMMELYKFWHQKTPYYGALALLGLMSYSAMTTKVSALQLVFEFGAVQWIVIILIAVGSAFFAMEYQNHTMLLLVYKQVKRRVIYGTKLEVILLYGVLLTVIAMLFTFVLKFLTVGQHYSWLTTQIDHRAMITVLLINVLGTLIYACFMVTLASLLFMLIRVNTVVIGTGLAVGLMEALPSWVNVLRWGPLNMIFITQQLASTTDTQVSHLTNPAIIGGTLAYAVLFFCLGYLLFKHRCV